MEHESVYKKNFNSTMLYLFLIRSCKNGQCLESSSLICDNEINCFDKSDEECTIYKINGEQQSKRLFEKIYC